MFRKQHSVGKQHSVYKHLVIAAALAFGASGVALADDNDMTRFGGNGYVYFHQDRPAAGNAPSTFRETNPRGLSIGAYETLSADGRPRQVANAPEAAAIAAMDAAKTWRQDNPHGLPISTYETLSADGRPWQRPNATVTSAVASTGRATSAN